MISISTDRVARDLAKDFAWCGIALSSPKGRQISLRTQPEIHADSDGLFRCASISKWVTGQTAARGLIGKFGETAGNIPIEELLGFFFRHPKAPDHPVTVGEVASHSAGLTDEGGYLVPFHVPLQDWLAEQGGVVWAKRLPGQAFEYCNLGYVLLAAATETAIGESFDLLAQRLVLGPIGVRAGFNWSGLAPAERTPALPLYRKTKDGFAAQIDTSVAPNGPVGPDGKEIAVDGGVAGQHLSRFSPQGGLRVSMSGLLQLAEALPNGVNSMLWRAPVGRLQRPDDVFGDYGWGLMTLDNPAIYPRPLIGHFATAYGFLGGIWWDDARQAAIAYGLNGLPEGDDSDDLHPEEAQIFAAIAEELG